MAVSHVAAMSDVADPVRKKPTQAEVDLICAKHDRLWQAKPGGARAVFAWMDLSGLMLRGRNLADADFAAARLHGCDLSGAKLDNANFFGADMQDINLTDASLRRADLRGACLRGADLSGADLRRAVLKGADLSRAVMHGAQTKQADFTDAQIGGARGLDPADLKAFAA